MLDDSLWVVLTQDAATLLLDLYGRLPRLVDVLHRVFGQLGHVALDVLAPRVSAAAVVTGIDARLAVENLWSNSQ